MSASAIRAGRAFVEIFADDSALRRTLGQSAKRLKSFGKTVGLIGAGVTAMGAAVAGPMVAITRGFAEFGDSLDKAAGRTGMAVENLSLLRFAAEQSGASLGAVERGAQRMSRTIGDAAGGSGAASKALGQLGLSAAELLALKPEDQFLTVADRLAAIENPTLRAAAAMEIFGRGGAELLPMLADGSAGIEALMQKGRELGLEMGTRDATAAAALTDAWHGLTEAWRAAKNMIGAALAPTLTELAEKASRYVKMVRDWLDGNRQLVLTIFKVAAGVVAVGTGITMLGGVLAAAGMALAGLSAGLGVAGVLLAKLLAVMGALLSPIGLVAAAVVGLGGYLLHASGTGGQAIDWLVERFQWLKDVVGETMGGVMDAIAAGDLGLAFEVAWAGVLVVWHSATQKIREVWAGIVYYVMTAWDEVVYFFEDTYDQIADLWQSVTGGMGDEFSGLTDRLKSAWTAAMEYLATAWNWVQTKITEGLAFVIAKIEGLDATEVMGIARENIERHQTEGGMFGRSRVPREQRERREREYAGRVESAASDLADATKQWEDAIGRARTAREQAESAAPPSLEERQQAALGAMAAGGTGIAAGTFSAAAAMAMGRGAGGQDPLVALGQKQLSVGEQMVFHLRRMSGVT